MSRFFSLSSDGYSPKTIETSDANCLSRATTAWVRQAPGTCLVNNELAANAKHGSSFQLLSLCRAGCSRWMIEQEVSFQTILLRSLFIKQIHIFLFLEISNLLSPNAVDFVDMGDASYHAHDACKVFSIYYTYMKFYTGGRAIAFL